jgi:hypothetical protein
MTRYSHHDAIGASVHDLDRGGARIEQVSWIDTGTGTVCIIPQPIRLTATGRVETRRIRFKAIWPIWAGQSMPMMFHCAGRM